MGRAEVTIIYVVDERAGIGSSRGHRWDPGRSEAIFKLVEFYLRELKISTADKILFVADGARWIWNRVGALLRRLGVKPDQVNESMDFDHAVEHLGTIAAFQPLDGGGASGVVVARRRRLLKAETSKR